MTQPQPLTLKKPPAAWQRLGRVIARGAAGEYDSAVTGDPCIVWDEARQRWRMFYFAMSERKGQVRCCNA